MFNCTINILFFIIIFAIARLSYSFNTSGDIRLVGGRNESEGRVEIFIHGLWGTVCDDGWDIDDAKVVCRQLGYKGLAAMKRKSYFGSNVMLPIILDEVNCKGNEMYLLDCESKPLFYHNCANTESAGVICAGSRLNNTNSTLPHNHTSWIQEMNLCIAENIYWLCSSDRACCYSSAYCCASNETASVETSSLIMHIVIGAVICVTFPISTGVCVFICIANRFYLKKTKKKDPVIELEDVKGLTGKDNKPNSVDTSISELNTNMV